MKRTIVTTTSPRTTANRTTRTKRKTTRRSQDFIQRIISKANRIFTRPLALIIVILAIVLALSEISDPSNSILTKVLKELGKNKFVTYITAHKPQTIAFISYCGATIAALPASQIFPATIISALLAFLIPEKTHWEYLIQTILLFLFSALRKPTDRFIILTLGVATWAAGWWAPSKSP